MLFSTVGQGWVFLWMMGAGALIAAWYGLLAGLRRLLAAGFWLSLAADLAFGAGTAAIFCAALVAADYGRFRLYSALGALAGFGLFAAAAWPPARRVAALGMRMIRNTSETIKDFRWTNVIFK